MNPFDEFEVFETSFDLGISSDFTEEDCRWLTNRFSDNGFYIDIDNIIMDILHDGVFNIYSYNTLKSFKIIIKGVKNNNNHFHGNASIYLSYSDTADDILKEDLKKPLLFIKANLINGKLDGKFIIYDDLSGISYKCYYNNGNKHGKEYITKYNDIIINNYYHGFRHGQQISFGYMPIETKEKIKYVEASPLPRKGIRYIQHYYFNKQTDYSIEYYSSGYIKFICHYYNDKKEGEFIIYEDLEENLKNHKETTVLRYPNVLYYRAFTNGISLKLEQNKTNGKFDQEFIGTRLQYPQKDLDYINIFYVNLYDKYKNIKIDVDY